MAVLPGLLTRRSTTADFAADSATAKLRRVLPARLAARLDALINTAEATSDARPDVAVESSILLLLAEATGEHQPVAVDYVDRNGRSSERVVHPYRLVEHHGRWYLTGQDSDKGELRQFRLDRITAVTMRSGTFTPPAGFEAAAHLLSALVEHPSILNDAVRGLARRLSAAADGEFRG
ncbi:WYL domain-containing protein [Nocardia sp. NPDC050718]|uniref:helix-turn-helix transcriptional regulator n=1 Tax=Nocardia sp. NPDC050718 TaxID=3155788 RepID=UPI0033D3A95E